MDKNEKCFKSLKSNVDFGSDINLSYDKIYIHDDETVDVALIEVKNLSYEHAKIAANIT